VISFIAKKEIRNFSRAAHAGSISRVKIAFARPGGELTLGKFLRAETLPVPAA
jgi:hypothetical protein